MVRTSLAALGGLLCLLAAPLALGACGGSAHDRVTNAAASVPATGPAGGGGPGAAGDRGPARAGAAARGASGAATGGDPRGAAGRRATAHEVADPEEANSFPIQGAVHHSAAATPAQAGEFVPAAGAASNAEVRAELARMRALQRAARRSERQALQPVAGGQSIGGDGTLAIPSGVPEAVQKVVAGANAIADFPYVFGGGHASFVDNAYDCSGSVSYALAAAGLVGTPETSGELESWGAPGPGRYITVYANAGHTYMYVDGVLYDTAGRSGPYASRWQVGAVDNSGYVARHYPGL
jgi:cell wall-associated NlpC family hydrolase